MRCKNPYCQKDIPFSNLFFFKRCCIDCFMIGYELPKLREIMESPKQRAKFEKWKQKKEKMSG